MKKLVAILIVLNCISANADERYAHEYSSDHDNRRNAEREREEWFESDSRLAPQRYQQNYQQPPIQIYLAPNQNPSSHDERHHRRFDDKQSREERYWRERREGLDRQPQTPYYENQFNRDDTHW